MVHVVSETGGPKGKDYCILYNPQWAHLPHDLSKAVSPAGGPALGPLPTGLSTQGASPSTLALGPGGNSGGWILGRAPEDGGSALLGVRGGTWPQRSSQPLWAPVSSVVSKGLGHCCGMSPVRGISHFPSLPLCWAGVVGQKSLDK